MKTGNHFLLGRGILVLALLSTLLMTNTQNVRAAAPSNDLFDGATNIIITGNSFTDAIQDVTGTATPKPGDPPNGEPAISCNTNYPGLSSLWYRYDPSQNGMLNVSTVGSNYDTVVAIWQGTTLANLVAVSCNNDYYSPIKQSFASAYVEVGSAYYVEVTAAGGIGGAAALSANKAQPFAVTDDLSLTVTFDPGTAVGVGVYDDSHANWTWGDDGGGSGAWTHGTGITGPFANTHTYSSTAGDTTKFNFVGDQFTLYYTKASNGGHMEVWIDNIKIQFGNQFYLDENSPTTQYQQTWASPTLDPGGHQVLLKNLTGTIYVDAIKVAYRIAPLGDISTDYNPTYQWNEVAGATWYYLWVNGPSGPVIQKWYQASAICGGGLCSVKPSTILGGGNHTWWVQTWNNVGTGPWSSAKYFTTAIPTIPDQATLYSPIGDIGTNFTPTFEWEQVPGATWFYLWINGPTGVVLKQWYPVYSACNGGTCSVTPSTPLAGGDYTWWIQPWNAAGTGRWSAPMTFHAASSAAPGQATLTAPTGDIGPNYNPTYQWNEVLGATWYRLWINGASGLVLNKWYQAYSICNAGVCSVTSAATLGGGNYSWAVQTWNDAGTGPWSITVNFITAPPLPPDKAILYTPEGDIGTEYNPTYQWQDFPGATWYYLWVNGSSGAEIKQWYQASSICTAGTCSVRPSTSLSGGNHTWWVQTWNSTGQGPWSDPKMFTTPALTVPGQATLTAPTGDIGAEYNPTYQWNEVSGATWYYLWVKGPSGPVIQKWYQAISVCSAGVCSVTPSTTLAGGSYRWWIQAWNSAGKGLWSDPMDFTATTATPPPGVP